MIAEKLTDDLQKLIEQIHEARAVRNTRRANLLQEQPTIAGAQELEGINKQFDSLRLAEDILQEAIKELRVAVGEGEDRAPWDHLVGDVLFARVKS